MYKSSPRGVPFMTDQLLTDFSVSRSTVVIETIAEREGVDPVDLREPLYEVIDPEALDAIVQSGDVRVTFDYHGYSISVSQTDGVEVTSLNNS